MIRFIFLSIFVIFTHATTASSLPDFPFINVTGEAKINVAPDTVTISFDLIAFEEDSEKALQAILIKGKKILGLCKESKIEASNITTLQLRKRTVRNRTTDRVNTGIKGYEVSQSYQIKIDDLSKYSVFVDKLVALNNTSSIHAGFGATNKNEILANLVLTASADAQRRADNLAKGMGVKIQSVFAVSEDKDFNSFSAEFGLGDNRIYASMEMSDISSNMFVPKTILFTKNVSAIYKIKE